MAVGITYNPDNFNIFYDKIFEKDLSGKIVESVSGLWIVFSSMGLGLLPYFVFSLIK